MLPGASATVQVPRADDVLVLAGSADPFDRAAFRALVGHKELVAVAVRLHAGSRELVALGPRLGLLEAADRKVVQELRPVPGLHDAVAFRRGIRACGAHVDDRERAADGVGGEFRRAAFRQRLIGERRRRRCGQGRQNPECAQISQDGLRRRCVQRMSLCSARSSDGAASVGEKPASGSLRLSTFYAPRRLPATPFAVRRSRSSPRRTGAGGGWGKV